MRQIHISADEISRQCGVTEKQGVTFWIYYKIHNWSLRDVTIRTDTMLSILTGLGIRVDEISFEGEKKYFIIIQPIEYVGLHGMRFQQVGFIKKSERLVVEP